MARAFVEVVGDSASAVRALEQTSVAVNTTGDSFKKLGVDADAAAAAMVKASSTRVDALLAQSASLKQVGAASAAGSTEQLTANELALRKQTQAYRMLGVQAAATHASMTQTAGTIGRGLTTYVTAPTAFIGYEAVKQALAYNQAILLIRTQAGASQAELDRMNGSVLQLVQSGQSFGQTATQMAQGLYYVESEGIRGARALAVIHAAAAGAAKGQTDMASTTNALTSAMKIWNVSASGAVKTMATIDAITATGKMHLEDLNNAFQTKFFTTAKQLGIPFEQAGAALDVFTKAGVPAETAANNMTTSFIKMLTPAKAAVPYLQQLGLTTDSLGRALQSGGLSKALGELAAGYDRLVQTSGKFEANRAVLESFGGSRSGAPALALVQQYASYMQSLGEIQRLNNPATFWSQVSQAMHTPAMQIKKDVAEIGADFIKLGTALAPTVATLAGGIAKITTAFGHLPGPAKDAIGVVVGLLAIGGPLGLAIKGVGTLLGGIGTAFRIMSGTAVVSAATTDAAVAGVGTAAVGAEAEVSALRLSLLSLPALIPITIAIVAKYEGANIASRLTNNPSAGNQPGPLAFLEHPLRTFFYSPALHDRNQRTHPGVAIPPSGPQLPPVLGEAFDHITHPRRHRDTRVRTQIHHDTPEVFTSTIPTHLQLQLARAQVSGNTQAERAALEAEQKFLQHELQIARTDKDRLAALQAEQTVNSELAALASQGAAAARSDVSAFKQRVSQDQLLAKARNDLAQGEAAAARSLLEKDKQRLEAMLNEAKTSGERAAVLRQLTQVNRALHSKSDQFQLSAHLQMEMARADAQAALTGQSGPNADQLRLAREAKAAAMKAINSHTLTLQGLIAAWQIVGQENSVLAQTKSQIDTYHAVSTAAIFKGLGLTHTQDMLARERLAQADAHRGYAPNSPTHQTHQYGNNVYVRVSGDDAERIVRIVGRHRRQTHQRAGARR